MAIKPTGAEGTADELPFHIDVGFTAGATRGCVFQDNLTPRSFFGADSLTV
jgi:hypothetical protein